MKLQIRQAGHTWEVDGAYVADDRAKHYAEHDPDTTYQEEYDYTLGDKYEMLDWFLNNMNLSDLPVDSFKLVQSPKSLIVPSDREEFDTTLIGDGEADE